MTHLCQKGARFSRFQPPRICVPHTLHIRTPYALVAVHSCPPPSENMDPLKKKNNFGFLGCRLVIKPSPMWRLLPDLFSVVYLTSIRVASKPSPLPSHLHTTFPCST